jgi:hypothetical protein
MEYHSIGRRPGFPSKIKLAFKKNLQGYFSLFCHRRNKEKKALEV